MFGCKVNHLHSSNPTGRECVKEVVESLPLEIFKSQLDMVLGNQL